jgi:hypothetical protein
MKINTNSFFYKWWHLTYNIPPFHDWQEPIETNLCSFCQRIFWVSLFVVVAYGTLATAILFLLGGAVVGAWHHPWTALIVVGSIVALFGVMAGLFFYIDSDAKHVVDTWVEAKTKGICPLIEFTDKNDTK